MESLDARCAAALIGLPSACAVSSFSNRDVNSVLARLFYAETLRRKIASNATFQAPLMSYPKSVMNLCSMPRKGLKGGQKLTSSSAKGYRQRHDLVSLFPLHM